MNTITAQSAKPGQTIKTLDVDNPTTITVVDGNWEYADERGPKSDDEQPTHVWLHGDLDESLCLPVDALVLLIADTHSKGA